MEIIKTAIPGVLIIEPKRFGDSRGFFCETYHSARYAAAGISGPFVQDNFCRSGYGVLRGLHLQYPNSQGKLVTVLHGHVMEVVVDARRGSPSFGSSVTVDLSEENGRQVFLPRGFAHGFVVLSESADFFYKCDNPYSPQDEIIVRWNDPKLAIDWRVENPQLSDRDRAGVPLADIERLPRYEP